MFMTLTCELSWQRLRPLTFNQKTKKSLFEPPFRALRSSVCTPPLARWKDFIFVVIELFSYLLRLRRYERKSVEVGFFRRGWVTLSADFRGKGASPTNHCWYQSSRVITLSRVIKISAVHHLDLSQSTRVTDTRTDGQTDRRTDGRTELRLLRPPSHMLAP